MAYRTYKLNCGIDENSPAETESFIDSILQMANKIPGDDYNIRSIKGAVIFTIFESAKFFEDLEKGFKSGIDLMSKI